MEPVLSFPLMPSLMASLMSFSVSSLMPMIVVVVVIVDGERVKMLIGKQIVMELPADEDSLNRIGVNSNEKLTDSVGHEPNDDEDHHLAHIDGGLELH